MPNWPMKQERRRWRRHWLNSPVRIISDAGEMDGFGLHVSEGGMYLFAVADLEPGGNASGNRVSEAAIGRAQPLLGRGAQ